MSKYYSRKECTHEGCKEFSIVNHRTHRDMREYESKKINWTCFRHSNIEEILSIENSETTEILTVEKNENGKYWRVLNASNLSSGIQYGNGYKAFAENFPIGTTLTVTAKIIIPIIKD